MSVALICVLILAPERLALKDQARVEGRFVRLVDVVDADEGTLARLASVYLGRAPAEGETRTITVEEIRRELALREIDPEAFTFAGSRVEVLRGAEESAGALRRAVTFEAKRHLLELHGGLRPDEISVRLSADFRGFAADGEIADVKVRVGTLPGAGTFSASIGGKLLQGDVRVLRAREILVAARDLPSGKVIDSDDVELRRVELGGDESVLSEVSSAVGAATVGRLRAGAWLAPSNLRLKPLVRKGDVVRALARDFEVDARAVEDGAPDAVIALEFLSTKNRFRAKVSGPGQVRVVENIR